MFNFDPINLIILLAASINLVLGVFIFSRNRRDIVNIWFAFFVLSLVAWSVSMVFYRKVLTIEDSIYWVRILYAVALFIPLTFIFFASYFPKGERSLGRLILWFLPIPTFFMLALVFAPSAIIQGVKLIPGQEKIILWGPYYFSYNIYFIVYFSALFIILFKKYFITQGIDRTQIKYILLGTFIPSILANTSNLLLPTFEIFKFNWAGQILTLVMVVFVVYAIVKHHLMNVKVITTEIFSVLVTLMLLVDALLAKTWLEFILKFGIFVGMAIFSVLLIKSVLYEVRTRERIAMLAQKLRRANVRLKKLDKAKSEFISIASHQLRTPLSIIKGFISMILEKFYGPISETVQDKMQKTLESNERLIKLVDHLLDLSHMDEGRMQFNFKRVALRGVVESTFEEYKLRAQAKKLKFIYQPPEKDNLFVQADDEKIRQVIGNLIDNAIKYTAKGKVEVSLKREDNEAVFSVKDTGIGILPEEKKDFFEKFSRGRRVSRIWTEGAGLGLYVARFIVDAHHGQIGVESEGEGKGSQFWVRLPLVG